MQVQTESSNDKFTVAVTSQTPHPASRPPLRVDSTLHLAWGLTLNLSSDSNQVEEGGEFNKVLDNLREEFKQDSEALNYLDNLASFLGAYLRSVGFERSVYANYLDTQKTKQEKIIDNLNDLADVSSFSQEGVIVRIASFLGIGSLADFAAKFFAPNAETTLNVRIGMILFFGFLGLAATSIVLKVVRGRRIQKAVEATLSKQQSFWTGHAKGSFKKSLKNLFDDVKKLAEDRYPDYVKSGKEPILTDDKELDRLMEDILPQTNLYYWKEKK